MHFFEKTTSFLYFFFFLQLFSLNARTECNSDKTEIIIDIVVDAYPREISWHLSYLDGDTIQSINFDTDTLFNKYVYNTIEEAGYFADTLILKDLNRYDMLSDTFCTEANTCLLFEILDEYNDAICCLSGKGFYNVRMNEELVATGGEYGPGESAIFNCGLGKDCFQPIRVEEGTHTASDLDAWYVFTPDLQGVYSIGTCDTSNDCDTKILVYDYCIGLNWYNSSTGFVSYANDGCEINDALAKTEASLFKGQDYYIRLSDNSESCNDKQVEWDIYFKDYERGCLDSLACNYNPTATISDGNCIYPNDPSGQDCPAGPDLIILEDRAKNSIYIKNEDLSLYDDNFECYLDEGCISGYGVRELFKFDLEIKNIGDLDYFIGQEPDKDDITPSSGWEWSPCHNHAHFGSFVDYSLYDAESKEIPVGDKQGVCLRDYSCDGGDSFYSCGYQGISAGCSDLYPSVDGDDQWECQWLDVTGIKAGIYTLIMQVNWKNNPDNNGRVETDYDNNWTQICIEFYRTGEDSILNVKLIEECNDYTDCAGVVFGDAKTDCENNCNGVAVRGDLNKDTLLNYTDTELYASTILFGNIESNECNDLNADGTIDVYDAVLQNYCWQAMTDTLPENDFWCDLPYNLYNPTDSVILTISEFNTEDRFILLSAKILTTGLTAFQFSVDSTKIDSIEMLQNSNDFLVLENEGNIIAISKQGAFINKASGFIPLLKVYVALDSIGEVCLNNFKTAVNDNRQTVETIIIDGCRTYTLFDEAPIIFYTDSVNITNDSLLVFNDTTILMNDDIDIQNDTLIVLNDTTFIITDTIIYNYYPVGINTLFQNLKNSNVLVYPNPFTEFTTFHFNENLTFPIDLNISDTNGKLLFSKQIDTKNYILERKDMPSGLYFYNVQNDKIKQTGKFLVF